MPITQGRMIVLVREAESFRDYADRVLKVALGYLNKMKGRKLEELPWELNALEIELQMIHRPQERAIITEEYHFRKFKLVNDRQKEQMRLRRGQGKYVPSESPRTMSRNHAAALAAKASAAEKFDMGDVADPADIMSFVAGPAKEQSLEDEANDPSGEIIEAPKFDPQTLAKLEAELAKPDKKKDG